MNNFLFALKFTAGLFLLIIIIKILRDFAAVIGEKVCGFFICLWIKINKIFNLKS